MSQLKCYTCLELNRKLSPLKDQVKFLFALLCPEMFTNTKAKYLICWECERMADKIKLFQSRLKKVNEVIELSFKGMHPIIEGLSSLAVTSTETITFNPSQSTQILPQNLLIVTENLPMLPENIPMLPENKPTLSQNLPMRTQNVPHNILELSLKDMLELPLQLDSQAKVKEEEEEEEDVHSSNDFDEMIRSTSILQVPIGDADPLLIPRLNQPAEIQVLPHKPVKDEIKDPSIIYWPQEVFIDAPKEEIILQGTRKTDKFTVRDPNLFLGADINAVFVRNTPVKSKNSDELLAKLLSTPSKCDELFLMRQSVPNSNPQNEPACSESSVDDGQRVPNSKKPESTEQSSGVASEEDEAKLVILDKTELNAHRVKRKQYPGYIAASYKCERCIDWFLSQEKLDEHNLKHDLSRGDSICEICEQRFADDRLRDEHCRQHYIIYECRKCPSRYNNRAQLSTHCRKKHDESTFICKKCFVVLKTYKERSRHIFETHIQRKKCEECNRTFSNAYLLKTHVLNIHKSKPVECPVCKKVVKKLSLKPHMKTHEDNSEEGAYCVDCGTTYKTKYMYELHLKTTLKHNTIEQLGFKCDHCEKYFANKVSLKNHLEEIGGVKYTCDICKKDSKTKRGLAKHIQVIHEGKKPKKKPKVCEICGKSFTVSKSLKEHLNIHLGLRPHVCTECGATFTYSAALFTHRRLKHKMKRKFEMTSKE